MDYDATALWRIVLIEFEILLEGQVPFLLFDEYALSSAEKLEIELSVKMLVMDRDNTGFEAWMLREQNF
ncbi:hypothetical protein [Roseivivax sp. THAF30]|uniref:hypothetical protein n=1 Tax=Roseivivax sp. THAF30 TaxID=2587852 RepID=UPI0020C751EB|nr:hypothetical protein [Roseivivax sp. THAF30]